MERQNFNVLSKLTRKSNEIETCFDPPSNRQRGSYNSVMLMQPKGSGRQSLDDKARTL